MSEEHRLRAKVDTLETEIATLRAILAPEWEAPVEIGTSRAQDRILSCLLAHERTCSDLMLWKATRSPGDYTRFDESGCLKVQICHLRKKMQRLGMDISNQHGKGYFLPAATRQRLLNWNVQVERAA